jgi:hypothetical protein
MDIQVEIQALLALHRFGNGNGDVTLQLPQAKSEVAEGLGD